MAALADKLPAAPKARATQYAYWKKRTPRPEEYGSGGTRHVFVCAGALEAVSRLARAECRCAAAASADRLDSDLGQ